MSQKFRIKNDKGLFIEVSPMGLVSLPAAKALRELILPTVEERYRPRCLAALDLLEQLPVVDSYQAIGKFDPMFNQLAEDDYLREVKIRKWTSRPHAHMKAYGWQAPKNAKAASSGDGVMVHSAQAAGWTIIGKVVESASWLNHMLSLAGLPEIGESKMAGAKTALKKSKELLFEPVDDFSELAGAQAWMLFVGGGPRGRQGGFLDDKGSHGPLGRARMFESAKAAAKTASSRGLSYWKVVKSSVELSGLEEFPGDSVDDKLAHAIALRENENLKKALDGASMEDLKARLAELEAKLGESAPLEAPKPARSSRL